MKRGLNININFTNKFLYTFLSIVILIAVGVGVFAFGTSSPSTIGHSAGELDLSGGVSGNAIFNDRVGIGTSNPQAKLNVNGEIIFGNNGLACDSNTEGSQRYNSNNKIMEYCDGNSWIAFSSDTGEGTGGGTLDFFGTDHTTQECIDAGGTPTNYNTNLYCRFNSNSCPSGWTRFENLGNTVSKFCAGSSGSSSCGNCGASVCTTSSHSWDNKAIETCSYTSSTVLHCGESGQLSCSTSTLGCSASLISVGCY